MPRSTSHNPNRHAVVTITAAFLLLALNPGLRGTAALGQTGFDSPEVRATADVVPPALLHGPHYQLGPTVRTFAFMNQYSVTSDYGPFSPPPGCAGWSGRSLQSPNCKRSIRAMRSPRRRSRPEKAWCKGPAPDQRPGRHDRS